MFGNDCYANFLNENLMDYKQSCTKPCHGIYADILAEPQMNNNTLVFGDEYTEELKQLLDEYQLFKRSFNSDFNDFFMNITENKGFPLIHRQSKKMPIKCERSFDFYGNLVESCEYKVKETLIVLEIYFGTPTFDKVTLDAKTNWVTQISMIGGTLGLFSGFSIMSGIEIIYFTVKIILEIMKKSDKPKIRNKTPTLEFNEQLFSQ